MQVILDIDLDVFICPVARSRRDDSPRLDDSKYFLDSRQLCLAILTRSLRIQEARFGCVLETHVEAIPAIENAIKSGKLSPPFHWIHVDAHDDLYGHPDSPPNSGNFLYTCFRKGWIGEFTYVYRDGHLEIPHTTDDFKHIDLFGKLFPLKLCEICAYECKTPADFVMWIHSKAFTPETADGLFYEVAEIVKTLPVSSI